MLKGNLFFKKLIPSNKKSWSVFFGCLVTASVFWLFLTFSRNFESELIFNLEYENFPKDKILISNPIDELNLKVKAKGFDLFSYTLFDKKQKVVLDLKDFKMVKRSKTSKYSFVLSDNQKEWFKEHNSNFKVLDYSNDTINLIFDDVASKKVSVKARYNLLVDTFLYQINDVSVVPDSITIQGSASFLSKINVVETQKINVVPENKKLIVPINRAKGVIKMEPNEVTILFNFNQLVQNKIVVPIGCIDCPKDIALKLFPSAAEILFTCTEEEFKSIKKADFKVFVNYNEIEKGQEKVFIQLQSFPKIVSNIKVSPAKAEYLIRKL